MFAVLQFSDSKSIFRKSKIESERINLPDGEAFFIVRVKKHLKKIPWKKLEKCLGILKESLVLPDDIKIAPDVSVTAFKPDVFPRILLINSAVDHIMKSDLSPDISLTVFDEMGIYENYIDPLVPKFSSIKIITASPEKYEALSQKLMEKYGFSLMVSTAENYRSDVIISHSCSAPLYFSGRVYTNEKKYLMNAQVFAGSGIELPAEYENLRPENIDRVLFAAALYEKCHVEEIGELKYKNFNC